LVLVNNPPFGQRVDTVGTAFDFQPAVLDGDREQGRRRSNRQSISPPNPLAASAMGCGSGTIAMICGR
jgi:hypothetical protein